MEADNRLKKWSAARGLLHWFFATVVCFLAVVLLIVKSPDQFNYLFSNEKLLPVGKEFLFGVIGVLALSISDGMETMSRTVLTESTKFIAQLLVMTTFVLGFCCSAWIAEIESNSTHSLAMVVFVSILVGVFQRLLLVGSRDAQ